jgi:cell division protein FtsB
MAAILIGSGIVRNWSHFWNGIWDRIFCLHNLNNYKILKFLFRIWPPLSELVRMLKMKEMNWWRKWRVEHLPGRLLMSFCFVLFWKNVLFRKNVPFRRKCSILKNVLFWKMFYFEKMFHFEENVLFWKNVLFWTMFRNVLSFSYMSFVINVIPYCCIFRSALSDEKRRLDARINELEEELEEERAQNEMLEEKAKRSQIAVNFCFYSIFYRP